MTTEQEYKEFLRGKRVAVVGPSKTGPPDRVM